MVEQLTDYAKALEKSADHGETTPSSSTVRVDSDRVPTEQHNTNSPTSENLAQLPPNVAFKQIAGTCSGCHREFRREK